ncbi:MAG: alpha-hydroxy-acid oxidizing protein [Halomonas sp.]|nr:alpha-hydroxy acid oxidase [Halomonas sp.]TVP47413.1 MAG: alpha-hydroxy-acid oxidizing protein [Halomonas sp.]
MNFWTQKKLSRIRNLHDVERLARRKLPRPIFGYIDHVAEDGRTHRANLSAFDEYSFLPKAFVNVAQIDLQTELFGSRYAVPFGIAPMGISALSAYQGDLVLARAAAVRNLPMIMSGSSLVPMEEVASVEGADWFQAYLPGTPEGIEALLSRIQRAGFKKLVVTLDYPVPPNPDNLRRAGFSSPLEPSLRLAFDGLMRPGWLCNTFLRTLWKHGMPHFENNHAERGAPVISRRAARDFSGRRHFDWGYLDLVRRLWPETLIVKGVLNPEDAVRAQQAGVDGIILSNHGARQLDCSISPLQVLPDVKRRVSDIPIMIDSGFRRGTDVIKALALGADFVFVGRPFNYAAAYAGQAGVEHVAELLQQEIERNMALLGLTSLSQLDRSCLYQPTTDEVPPSLSPMAPKAR